jgi:5-hydroxyisourate hydrolase
MSGLTTHILDTTNGIPARGVKIELFKYSGGVRTKFRETITNDDGRTESPMLSAEQMVPYTYELLFYMGDYFRDKGTELPDQPFFDVVSVRFTIHDHTQHYHVPLLVSPWGYTTYRGS